MTVTLAFPLNGVTPKNLGRCETFPVFFSPGSFHGQARYPWLQRLRAFYKHLIIFLSDLDTCCVPLNISFERWRSFQSGPAYTEITLISIWCCCCWRYRPSVIIPFTGQRLEKPRSLVPNKVQHVLVSQGQSFSAMSGIIGLCWAVSNLFWFWQTQE